MVEILLFNSYEKRISECNIIRYICTMIVSIRHKGLRLLWEKGDASKLPAGQVKRIMNIMTLLDAAGVITDMDYPGSGLHSLKGNFSGFYAVTVTGNWRIVFRFEDGDAYLVNYLDYH